MKNWFLIIVMSLSLALPHQIRAAETYPKIANYYLNFFTAKDYKALSKYDLLILQPEMAISQAKFFTQYRQAQPNGKLLAYLYPASFYRESLFYDYFSVRQKIFNQINCHDWWLRDVSGDIISPWPGMSAINLTKPDWQKFNLDHLIKSYGLAQSWDGVMWDLVDSQPSRYSAEPIDVLETRVCAPQAEIDRAWQAAMADFLTLSRERLPKKIILINGDSLPFWQSEINGRIFEHFPTPWEGLGGWQASMKQYLRALPRLNQSPQAYVLNTHYDQSLASDRYQQMRFGLSSALLGSGYFSFDDGAASHSQLWWFDEYNVDLGRPLGQATNLTGSTALVAPGLWWREFERGAVLVNSSPVSQKTTLATGKYRRLTGRQAPDINNGQVVSELEIKPMDGIVLVAK